ncbi:MAG: isoprenylcysteine carboxylmethyltransferase family protein [Acidobacteriota bacterium]
MPLPTALRWLGVLGAAVCIPLIGWLLHHLGTNVSPTAATRADHRLVTSGPYRFVRHPLYTVGAAWWLGLGVAMASWWILLCVALAFVAIDRRTAREEAALLERFGDEYRRYSERTPRYLPRWSAPGRPAPG